jgi:hypothetical protein
MADVAEIPELEQVHDDYVSGEGESAPDAEGTQVRRKSRAMASFILNKKTSNAHQRTIHYMGRLCPHGKLFSSHV